MSVSIVGFAWSVPYSWIRARCVVRTFRHESDSFRTCPDANSQSRDTDTPPSFHPIQVLSTRSRLTNRLMRVFQDGMLQLKMLIGRKAWSFILKREKGKENRRLRRRNREEHVGSKMVTPSQRGKLGMLSRFPEGQSIISRNMLDSYCMSSCTCVVYTNLLRTCSPRALIKDACISLCWEVFYVSVTLMF